MRVKSSTGILMPRVWLFHDRRKYERFIRKHFETVLELYDTEGQMFYDSGMAIVLMEHEGDPNVECSLLVHEAYHVVCAHMAWLGETEPGEEVMAYYIQTMADSIFKAHDRWKRRHGKVE